MLSQHFASHVAPDGGVHQVVALVHGDGLGRAVPGAEHNSGEAASGVHGERCGGANVHCRDAVLLKHGLNHLNAVAQRRAGGLCQEDGVVLRGQAQFMVKDVAPEKLHVMPILDYPSFDGVGQRQHPPPLLGCTTDVPVRVVGANHCLLCFGAPDDGGDHATGGLLGSQPCLNTATAGVDHDRPAISVVQPQGHQVGACAAATGKLDLAIIKVPTDAVEAGLCGHFLLILVLGHGHGHVVCGDWPIFDVQTGIIEIAINHTIRSM
mmetsp:Transcript_89360/g.154742  ORF Transcript_89360/g.154742 Transcript_89360/m.154742 type:complete len:265 (+) Transcript_89360:2093-2887(+)